MDVQMCSDLVQLHFLNVFPTLLFKVVVNFFSFPCLFFFFFSSSYFLLFLLWCLPHITFLLPFSWLVVGVIVADEVDKVPGVVTFVSTAQPHHFSEVVQYPIKIVVQPHPFG
jgi:hypothetical protein